MSTNKPTAWTIVNPVGGIVTLTPTETDVFPKSTERLAALSTGSAITGKTVKWDHVYPSLQLDCMFYAEHYVRAASPWGKESTMRASLVAQWLRICLPMQATRVRALVWEDPTCRGATRPMSHNY